MKSLDLDTMLMFLEKAKLYLYDILKNEFNVTFTNESSDNNSAGNGKENNFEIGMEVMIKMYINKYSFYIQKGIDGFLKFDISKPTKISMMIEEQVMNEFSYSNLRNLVQRKIYEAKNK